MWLNEYHLNVLNNVSPLLADNSNMVEWLKQETQPISKQIDDCNETATDEQDSATEQ